MTTLSELDPILKALRIFHSESSDAAEKLKMMLDEAVENSKRSQANKDSAEKSTISSKAGKLLPRPRPINATMDPRKKEKDLLQKRHYDKLHKDLEELQEIKKPRIDTSSPSTGILSSTSGTSHSTSKPNPLVNELVRNGGYGKVSPMSNTSTEDFELQIAELACVICRHISAESEVSETSNRLVECQDCHKLYHQECHQPRISNHEVNGLRCVWYCIKCKRNMKKQEKQNFSKSPQVTIGNPMDSIRLNSLETKTMNSVAPFKRTELRTSVATSSNGAGSGSLSGWAALGVKPVTSANKVSGQHAMKPETQPYIPKEKYKPPKNNLKNSLAWAEALGAESTTERVKASHKSVIGSNNIKHLNIPNSARPSKPGASALGKPKSTNSLPTSNKTTAFPKVSATGKDIAMQEQVDRRLLKKKGSAKMLVKRAKV